jgi:multidrug efflux pump subunit AcrA (membrane-fusion protein)
MYVDVSIVDTAGTESIVVPQEAVQALGDRFVVYVPRDPAGVFVEREVRLGRRVGDLVEIESGLASGEDVVVKGAFFLRSERERVSPGASESR